MRQTTFYYCRKLYFVFTVPLYMNATRRAVTKGWLCEFTKHIQKTCEEKDIINHELNINRAALSKNLHKIK